MRLTSKIPDWKRDELKMLGMENPIAIKLCNYSQNYIEKDTLLTAHATRQLINVEATCKRCQCMHWAKFNVTDAQARWLQTL